MHRSNYKVLFDLSALSATSYKTGIPNYVFQLARALGESSWTVLGTIDNAVFEPRQTRGFLEHCFVRLNAPPVPRRSAKEKFLLAVRDGAVYERIQKKTVSGVRRVLNRSQHFVEYERRKNARRAKAVVDAQKPAVQHMCSNAIFKRYDLPLAVTMYDLSPIVHPELHESENLRVFDKLISDLKIELDRGYPVRFLAISEYTKSEIHRVLGPEFSQRTDVTPLGIDQQLFCAPPTKLPQVGDPFILSVGTLEPRKNLALLLDAFETIALKHPTLRLKLVGAKGWKGESLNDKLARHPQRLRIDVCGYLSDFELATLYQTCEVFCYPSLYEGFGLPVLEAMSCGAAVVTSQTSSLPEVLGPGGLYCDPHNPKSLATALEQALDEQKRQSDYSLDRAKHFSWKRCAELTLNSYDALIRS